jgi:plasmid stabilization system protein ParE
MKYTVFWSTIAESQLAEIWLTSADRNAVAKAAHEIDERLRADAENQGESRDHGRRFLFLPPLAVYFRVFDDDRRVYVVSVREIRPRTKE